MVNRRPEPVNYRPFRVEPNLANGLLSVPRDDGEFERRVAQGLANMADQFGQRAELEASAAGQRQGAADALAGAPRASKVTGGEITGTASPNGQAGHVLGAQSGVRVIAGDGVDQAKAILRHEEGFRSKAYWDVNAWRVGYGSDTVTLADGRSVPVTKDTVVSRDDAERDLNYRFSSREGAAVRGQLGDAWDKLNATAQGVLLSVGYNYGSLPDTVVNAVKTGGMSAIADAVRGLSANAGRRAREADLLSGAGGHPSYAKLPDAAADGPISVTPVAVRASVEVTPGSPGSFKPRGGISIYDRAYDVSGTRTYTQLLDQVMMEDQQSVFDAYKDDPAMLRKAMGQLEQAHMKDHVFPELEADYQTAFRKNAFLYQRRAEQALQERKVAQDRVDFDGRVQSLENQKSQALAGLDPNDPLVASKLSTLQGGIDSHYDSAVSRGIYTPEQAAELKQRSRSDMVTGFYLGQAKNKVSAAEIASLRSEMTEDYAAGKLEGVSASDWERINKGLAGAEDARRSQDALANKALKQRGDDIAGRVARGLAVAPEDLAQFQLDIKSAPDGPEIARKTFMKLKLAEALRTQPVREIEGDMWNIIRGQDGYVSPDDYDAAVKMVDAHKAEVTKDPLGVAERFGIVPSQGQLPDPGTASPDDMAAGLTNRILYADVAAEHFGVAPKYFRPEEEDALKRAVTSTDVNRHSSAMKQLDVFSSKLGLQEVEHLFGKDALDRLQDWQGKVRYATPAEAQQWLKDRNDPKWREMVKPLVTKGEAEARKLSADDVVGMLDENGMFRSGVDGTADKSVRDMMMGDFTRLVGERYAATQDIKLAQSQAADRMKKVWGTSDVFGGRGGRLMLYPPEEHYPTVAGSHDWMGEELASVAKDRGYTPEGMALVADGKTRAAIERKEVPGYLLSHINPETGYEELVTDDQGRPLRHFFDPKAAQATAAAKAEKARRTRNDPWLVLGKGTSIGPLYPFGADPADLAMRDRRAAEIAGEQQDTYQMRKQNHDRVRAQLRENGIPGGK